MSSKTPNYVLTEDYQLRTTLGKDPVILPKGSFVRPINYCYLPKHIIEDNGWLAFDLETFVFAYTKFGIFPIPRDILRLV